jgi:hypothetical protein
MHPSTHRVLVGQEFGRLHEAWHFADSEENEQKITWLSNPKPHNRAQIPHFHGTFGNNATSIEEVISAEPGPTA